MFGSYMKRYPDNVEISKFDYVV